MTLIPSASEIEVAATDIKLTQMCREAKIGGNGTNDIKLSEAFPDHQSGLYRSHFGVISMSFWGHYGVKAESFQGRIQTVNITQYFNVYVIVWKVQKLKRSMFSRKDVYLPDI